LTLEFFAQSIITFMYVQSISIFQLMHKSVRESLCSMQESKGRNMRVIEDCTVWIYIMLLRAQVNIRNIFLWKFLFIEQTWEEALTAEVERIVRAGL
jgi:hypothetical protein